jgi:hypothetical protein
MTKRSRAIVLAVIGALVVPIVAYGCWIAYPFVEPDVEAYLKATRFDSVKWKARSLDGDTMWPTRLRMADDLLRIGTLRGAPREEVERLLGPPDQTSYFKNWSMVYWLGPERGFIRIDSEWLALRLNQQGVVAEVEIVRD